MKVLHVISGLTLGGAEMSLYRLAQALRREGVESVVVCLGQVGGVSPLLEREGFEVHTPRLQKNLLLPVRLLRLVLLARRLRPDAIQGWMYPGNLAATFMAAFSGTGVPVYWGIRQSLYTLAHEKPFMARLIRICRILSGTPARIVYNARASRRQHEAFGYDASKGEVIPNGFDTEAFAPLSPASRRAVRAELSLPPNILLIGLVGRDHPKKDRAGFLEAAILAARELPDAHYLLLGRAGKAAESRWRERVEAAGLRDRFTFAGEQQDAFRWIAALDIAVSSSFAEGFPNVIGEAMACCVPCVVTDVGDSGYLLGEAGLRVPPRDPAALAAALVRLANAGPGTRGRMGAAGRSRILENFSLEAAVSRYLDLYKNDTGNQ
jgi:glycosyltransferase involved in cell wall biosynthesis